MAVPEYETKKIDSPFVGNRWAGILLIETTTKELMIEGMGKLSVSKT